MHMELALDNKLHLFIEIKCKNCIIPKKNFVPAPDIATQYEQTMSKSLLIIKCVVEVDYAFFCPLLLYCFT